MLNNYTISTSTASKQTKVVVKIQQINLQKVVDKGTERYYNRVKLETV